MRMFKPRLKIRKGHAALCGNVWIQFAAPKLGGKALKAIKYKENI